MGYLYFCALGVNHIKEKGAKVDTTVYGPMHFAFSLVSAIPTCKGDCQLCGKIKSANSVLHSGNLHLLVF